MQLIADIMDVWYHYEFNTEVLVASVRHPMHVVEAAKIGADICTMPYEILEKLVRHPLTDAGLKKFTDDWAKVGKKGK